MSLVNDALKRAKQAQKNAPPIAPAPLRPVDPAPRSQGGLNPLVSAVIAGGLLLVVGLTWSFSSKTETPPPIPATPAVAPVAATPPAAIAPQPVPAAPVVSQIKTSNAPAVAVAVEPPKTPAPRLQGIFFDPTRPTAIVSGRTVAVGGRVGDFRVAAISAASVTLTSATQTNVLTLVVE